MPGKIQSKNVNNILAIVANKWAQFHFNQTQLAHVFHQETAFGYF